MSNNLRLWKLHKAVLQLCRDRGYVVDELDLPKNTFLKRCARYTRSDLNFLVPCKDNPTDKLVVFFPEESPIDLNAYIKFIETNNIHRCLFVLRSGLTRAEMSVLSEYPAEFWSNFTMEQVIESDLIPPKKQRKNMHVSLKIDPDEDLEPVVEEYECYEEPKKRFVCSVCNKEFRLNTSFKKHAEKHNVTRCLICKHAFKSAGWLKRHMIVIHKYAAIKET